MRLPLFRVACLAACLFTLMSGAAACARSGDRLGSGPDVGFCDGWQEFDGLAEPPLSDRTKVVRWAEGEGRILHRIDTRVKVTIDRRTRELPQDIVTDLHDITKLVSDFIASVRKASTDDGLRRAVADLNRTPFNSTADRLTQRRAKVCQ